MATNPVTVLASGNLIIATVQYNGVDDKLVITKTNANGGIIWQKNLATTYGMLAGKAFETASGDIIAIGGSQVSNGWTTSNVFIAKLNATTGDTIWTKRYGKQNSDNGIVGYEAADNTFWIADFWNLNNKAMLLHIGANGDSLSSIVNATTNYPTYRDALVTSTKKLILVGDFYICSYTNGVRDFSNTMLMDSLGQMRVNDVCETSDGGYVVSGEAWNTTYTNLRYGLLIKYNASGIKLWEKNIKVSNGSEIYSCIEKKPDLFYLGMGGYNATMLYNYDFTTLNVVNSAMATSGATDAQLLINNNLLYRVELGIGASFYITTMLKAYPITF